MKTQADMTGALLSDLRSCQISVSLEVATLGSLSLITVTAQSLSVDVVQQHVELGPGSAGSAWSYGSVSTGDPPR